MAEVTLNVKIAPSGEKFVVKIDKNAPVEEFKRLVTEQSSVPADQQRLIYKGHVLRDQRTLVSYGIDNDHTILLVRGVKAEEKAAAASTAPASSESAASNAPSSASSPPPSSANNANPAAAANPFAMFMGGQMGGFGDMGAEEGDGANANPFGGLGMGMGMEQMMGNPQMLQNMLNNPMMMQMVQQMMSNPQMMEMMMNMNPMMRNMPPAMQAQVRQVMANPQLMQAVLNPQNLQAMMQMQQAMGQARGGNPFAAMFAQQPPAANAAAQPAADAAAQPAQPPAAAAAQPAQPAAAAAAAPQADPFAALMQMMMQPPAAQNAAAAAQPAANANVNAPAAPANPLMNPGFMQAMMQAMQDGQQNHNLGIFGPPRQGAAAAAGPAERPEMVYRNQLATLNDMGFHNLEANLNALMATGGNIEAAVDRLTSGR